ncbi:MAG: hypothetical protein KC731_32870 [Myxococcales bacterium]|nr:hypothetical protein [Myxococcales bacterium]
MKQLGLGGLIVVGVVAACGARNDILYVTGAGGGEAGSGPGAGGAGGDGGGTAGGGNQPDCLEDVDCVSLTADCAQGKCQGGSCVAVNLPNGTGCDDGSVCSQGDLCFDGVCSGSPVDCGPPPGQCWASICDDIAGCVAEPLPEGSLCDDGDACTPEDFCSMGTCVGGPADCTDLDGPCTIGQCTPNGCVAVPKPDGTSCNDGDPCTSTDFCAAGTCIGTGGPTAYFSDDFSDNSAGWTLGTDWQIGPAMASMGSVIGGEDPAMDHTNTNDNGVAGLNIGGLSGTTVHGPFWLESPTFNASAPGPVILTFWRWLNSDWAPFMNNFIEVWDGMTWHQVWQSGPPPAIQDAPPNGPGWNLQSFDITSFKSSTMRIRFGMEIGQAGAFQSSSWNIDDVVVANAQCP